MGMINIEAVALTRDLHIGRSCLKISKKKNSFEKYLTESRSPFWFYNQSSKMY